MCYLLGKLLTFVADTAWGCGHMDGSASAEVGGEVGVELIRSVNGDSGKAWSSPPCLALCRLLLYCGLY